jgi:myo-inositol 2-dehydrogenase/D-chiro-inositol 1-dehydrogenase
VAVCDLDENLAQSVAAKFGAENWYTDNREMSSKENLDAVIVQIHPRARRSMVTEALAGGYHVFVPRPPAASLAEAEEPALAAKRVDKVLMVNFRRRFSLVVTRAREIMRNDSFGELTQISCSFCSGLFTGVRGQEYENPVHAFLLDMAPHHLDLARYLGGEVQSMSLHHVSLSWTFWLLLALANVGVGHHGTVWQDDERVDIQLEKRAVILDRIARDGNSCIDDCVNIASFGTPI